MEVLPVIVCTYEACGLVFWDAVYFGLKMRNFLRKI